MRDTKPKKLPLLTLTDISNDLGVTKTRLQSFIKRTQTKHHGFATPAGTVLSGKAVTNAYTKEVASIIKSAWNHVGPGRKKMLEELQRTKK